MTTEDRPLSPHLQIYKPQLTSVLSILHRMTGIALAVGLLMLAWWVIAAASGPPAFAVVQDFNASWVGRLLLFGWSFALFYHLCNGIRHLFWDAGYGFELPNVYASGRIVVVGLLMLAWWVIAAASGPPAFAVVQDFNASWVGRLLLFGWSFALFYHLCNGIRHLFWDAGYGFELPNVYASGRIVVVAAVVLTVLAWLWGYDSLGAWS